LIVTTSSEVHGRTIKKTVGLVKGSTIRARHLGRDIMAVIRSLVGGEISDYTKMMADAREEALQRMIRNAESQGANAVVDMRFGTSMVMQNAAEVVSYGTAVVLE